MKPSIPYELIGSLPTSHKDQSRPTCHSPFVESDCNFCKRRSIARLISCFSVFVVILLLVAYYFLSTSLISSLLTKSVQVISFTPKAEKEVASVGVVIVGCKIPKLNPFDPAIKHLLKSDLSILHCNTKKYGPIYELQFTKPFTLLEVKQPKQLNVSNCCYKLATRKKSQKNPDNAHEFSKTCFPLKSKVTMISKTHELLAVYCKNNKKKPIMMDVFPLAPLKPKVEERISKFYQNNKEVRQSDQVNLVVLGIDAVSHMNLQRIMPKVHTYLVKNLSAISMNGYNRVGDNTLPNMMAVLGGINMDEAEKTCVKNKSFDDCPMIWKKFSAQGYRTSYGEDKPAIGIFNYIKTGFRAAPTDYYMRPLAKAADDNIVNGYKDICYGARLSLDVLLNYMKAMATAMDKSRRYFQLLWATALTHDFLNHGHIAEPTLLSFFHWFQKRGYLNNTVFVLMSDHGIRWGPMRRTPQGKVEENMPFMYFMFPSWFKEKYKLAMNNIRRNSDRLTTPFDVHELFSDILNLESITDSRIMQRQNELYEDVESGSAIPRGISLFLPIPKSRTCKMAEIKEHYCLCHGTRNISNAQVSQQVVNYAVHKINSFVEKHTKCALLTLKSVQNAQEVVPDSNNGTLRWSDSKEYHVTFTTTPGDAIFDATIMKKADSKLEISGVISRTNLYGNQSHCVEDTELKKYCFCIKMED